MDFTRPQDYIDVLKKLEGLPLMGMEIKDGRLVFHSLSSHVALPMGRQKGYGYGVVDYGLNKLDVMLFDEDSTVIAHVTVKNLHSSMNVNHGDGFDMLRICAADPVGRKPVVMFRLDQDILNGKELSFNVI